MSSNIQWIKLSTDLFDNIKIKKIRSLPQGNDLLLVWIYLLIQAGKCNAGGYIFITQNIPLSRDDISSYINLPVTTIDLALKTFEKLNMINIENDYICISNFSEDQSLIDIDKKREQDKLRAKKYREKKKKQILNTSQKTSRDGHKKITCRHGIEEIRSDKNRIDNIYIDIISYLNSKTGKSFKHTTQSYKKDIDKRIKSGATIEDFKRVIDFKCSKWINDKTMCEYLRPSTLFGNKFDSYLDESQSNINDVSNYDYSEQIKKAESNLFL